MVPIVHGKADLTIYCEAGNQVGWRIRILTNKSQTSAHCAMEGRPYHLPRGKQAGGLAHWKCDAEGANWCPLRRGKQT